ncbi:centriole, cilia and spindle-associated protein [Maylandia zebra]|uniref:Centriole, cilia and spindle-associated protein b n=2 Tax=Haplochromini TaxID=319058 RepID=A0A3P9BXK3_9CICH|nr:centriole, cilia and spindle-associated protein [Maylandia zebra]XP_026026596.1 centriole, cilia and spindle-associated protein-like [Astatotilapia calliptera]
MVAKRIRSEYMKKFKDPKWDTYTKCYEEMLKYRLTRRLLEHTHNPWFWSGSDTDSDSGGRSPPIPPSKNQVRDQEDTGGRAEAELEECGGARTDTQQEQSRTSGPVPRLPIQEEEEDTGPAAQSALHASDAMRETKVLQEEQRASNRERDSEGPRPQQSKPSKSLRQPRRSQRVRPAPSRLPREDSKESRHPFALYGSGEKDADTAGRKTHNVGPVASTNEIYESALRAKTRREVERHIQTQRSERRRAKSADLDKARKVVQPEFNPWLTEYMRCFSARSR